MKRPCNYLLVGLVGLLGPAAPSAEPAKRPVVTGLFEDQAEAMLKLLTNPGDGPGEGQPETKDVFSGTHCLKITRYQRFQRRLPGWEFAIRKDPQPGEYRFLRFAWKAHECPALMLQLHDSLDWHIRYTAGPNVFGWTTRFVAEHPPASWKLVTVDLFADFGERMLTGIAFTTGGGTGYFDHVYLGRTVADLDAIDADRMTGKQLALPEAELQRHWQDLLSDDAARAYRAYWTLVGGGRRTTTFLRDKVGPREDSADLPIRRWIDDLNSDSYPTREKATALLRKHADVAAKSLEAARDANPSPEARRRISLILAARAAADPDPERRRLAVRILRVIEDSEK